TATQPANDEFVEGSGDIEFIGGICRRHASKRIETRTAPEYVRYSQSGSRDRKTLSVGRAKTLKLAVKELQAESTTHLQLC
ncbi:MAG: hypothetical protein JWM11_6916, partial [Planctomycetaceae bacterium]|nr:hypothetical protein [Planctomycetaceae bacterium]